MRGIKILVCQALGIALSTLLLGGCGSNQQARCAQEVLKLQETIDAQQIEIEELNRSIEATTGLLFEATSELEKYRVQLPKKEGKKESDKVKAAKNPKPRRVSRTKRNTKTPSRTNRPKKKGGCPCRQKRK
jgi:hypothetical protein